jgi:uncharacterized protein (TIGR02597 family)
MQEIRGYYLLITQTFKFMKAPKIICTVAALAFSIAALQAVETDPVGFVSVTVKANSDATIAVPVNRASEFKGTVASVLGNQITVSGTPGWLVNQFVFNGLDQVKTYAVQIASNVGGKEGMIGKITSNTNNAITIQLDSGDTLSGIAAGEQIDIMPYWTPSTLFSAAPAVGFELAGFELGETGINFGATEIYSHNGSNSWEDLINGGDGSHTPLRFGSALIARNSSGTNYTATFVGSVPMSTTRIRFSTKAANMAQDHYVGYMCPVAEPLATATNPNALGFPVQVGDTIQGFDNTVSGINKGADEIYSWTGTAWEDLINGGDVIPNIQSLKPGFGYIFQKAATATPTSVVWSKTPSYLQ